MATLFNSERIYASISPHIATPFSIEELISGLSNSLSALSLSPRSELGFQECRSPRISPSTSPHFFRRKNPPVAQRNNVRNQLTVPLEDAPPIPLSEDAVSRISHDDQKCADEQSTLDRHQSCPSVHSPFINSLSKAHTLPQLSPSAQPTNDIIPPAYDQLRFTTDYENASIIPECVETRVISAKRNPYISNSKQNLVRSSLQDSRLRNGNYNQNFGYN